MADITSFLNAISTARYGEDVRASIKNAISAINSETETTTSKIDTALQKIGNELVNATNIKNGDDLNNFKGSFKIYIKWSSATDVKNFPQEFNINRRGLLVVIPYESNIFQIYIDSQYNLRAIRYYLSSSSTWESWVCENIALTDSVKHGEYRGKQLGTSVTEEQLSAIRNGTFDNLYVGDYWIINDINWRIADIDYWYNTGDSSFTNHHLVIVPDTFLYNAVMNDKDTTDGGYVGSKMYTENLEQAKQKIKAIFGDMLLSHKEYLINAVTDGHGSGGAWFDSEVELMNEIMVYGCHIRAAMNMGSPVASTYTVDKQQLALFRLNPKMINRRISYWLRDVASADAFSRVGAAGGADTFSASTELGVRPAFAIG